MKALWWEYPLTALLSIMFLVILIANKATSYTSKVIFMGIIEGKKFICLLFGHRAKRIWSYTNLSVPREFITQTECGRCKQIIIKKTKLYGEL